MFSLTKFLHYGVFKVQGPLLEDHPRLANFLSLLLLRASVKNFFNLFHLFSTFLSSAIFEIRFIHSSTRRLIIVPKMSYSVN